MKCVKPLPIYVVAALLSPFIVFAQDAPHCDSIVAIEDVELEILPNQWNPDRPEEGYADKLQIMDPGPITFESAIIWLRDLPDDIRDFTENLTADERRTYQPIKHVARAVSYLKTHADYCGDAGYRFANGFVHEILAMGLDGLMAVPYWIGLKMDAKWANKFVPNSQIFRHAHVPTAGFNDFLDTVSPITYLDNETEDFFSDNRQDNWDAAFGVIPLMLPMVKMPLGVTVTPAAETGFFASGANAMTGALVRPLTLQAEFATANAIAGTAGAATGTAIFLGTDPLHAPFKMGKNRDIAHVDDPRRIHRTPDGGQGAALSLEMVSRRVTQIRRAISKKKKPSSEKVEGFRQELKRFRHVDDPSKAPFEHYYFQQRLEATVQKMAERELITAEQAADILAPI